MVRTPRQRARHALSEHGFSLVELLVAMTITTAVVGGAVALTSAVERTYSYEVSDAAVQQEGRFAMDWITRTLAVAGSNPYNVQTSACPAAGTAIMGIRLDPNANGIQDDIRVQGDVNPANGVVLGLGGACNESGEDVTIAHNAANLTLTRHDRGIDAGPVAVTDQVFTQLLFTYLTAARVATVNANNVAYVQVTLTARSRGRNPHTGQFTTFTYRNEVRLRTRP